MGFGVTGTDKYVKYASVATAVGFAANTLAVAHRWYLAGRPPFASIYEMLLSFVWTLALLTLITEKKFGVKIIGSITMPLAVVCVILMQLLPSEVRPLVPALQSTWLHVHVTLAMLSYAACAVSFALAMMFLIQDNFKTETFLAGTSTLVSAIYIAIVATRFEQWGGLSVTAWDAESKSDMFLGRGVRLFVTIPDLGWLFVIAALAAIVPLALYCSWRVQAGRPLPRHRQQSGLHRHSSTSRGAGGFRTARERRKLRLALSGGTVSHIARSVALHPRRHGHGRVRLAAVPDAAVAAQRPAAPAAQRRRA